MAGEVRVRARADVRGLRARVPWVFAVALTVLAVLCAGCAHQTSVHRFGVTVSPNH